jgi:RNA polymerase sigma factor (sigma-70 family)
MVERIYGVCLRHARRVLPGDPALEPADLVQHAYVRVGARLDALATDQDRANILCRTITRLAVDHYRRLGRRPQVPLTDERADALVAPGDLAGDAETAEALDAALATPRLGLAECALLGLGYTYAQIAERLGIQRTTVATRIHRAHHHREGG